MVAVARVALRRQPQDQARAVQRPGGKRLVARQVVAAEQRAHAEQGPLGRAGRLERQDSASAPAILRRDLSTHDLDALRKAQVQRVDLGLAVGKRVGNAIAHHPDSAHAEGRARAEAADRDARILRGVAARLCEDAGDQVQRVGQVVGRPRAGDLVAREHGDRDRGPDQARRRVDRLPRRLARLEKIQLMANENEIFSYIGEVAMSSSTSYMIVAPCSDYNQAGEQNLF